MRVSEPILPLRIYSDLYEQHRFNSHCYNTEQFRMVFPQDHLPHFQFTRDASDDPPTELWIRNVCEDVELNYRKMLPEPISNFGDYGQGDYFTFDNASFTYTPAVGPPETRLVDITDLSCGRLIPKAFSNEYEADGGSFAAMHIALPVRPAKYHLKLIIETFKRSLTSSFSIKVYTGGTGGTLLVGVARSGIFNLDFVSAGDLTIEFNQWEIGDEFSLSYVQMTFIKTQGTIQLDETDLKVIPAFEGKDAIVFCRSDESFFATPFDIPPGDYYYIINDNGTLYYSEVFSIIAYKEIEKYYKLVWYHDCDLASLILYNEDTLGCAFRNILYLEAALFKPEPETKVENDDNGEANTNITFRSWKRSLNLEVLKSPEFITDALSGVFLHDNVLLTPPLNKNQDVPSTAISVKQVTPEISQVLNDCYQKVNLKLLMQDIYTDSSCCNNIEV